MHVLIHYLLPHLLVKSNPVKLAKELALVVCVV